MNENWKIVLLNTGLLVLLSVPACDLGGGSAGGAPGPGAGDSWTGGDVWVAPESPGWNEHFMAAPCRANALWFDDRQTGFLGCGDKGDGAGLWVTSDGGLTWEGQEAFEEIRINDIRRGPDGLLYGAGQFLAGESPVFTIDEGGAELGATGLYVWGNKASTSVGQAENVAVTEDGQVLIDSLTGTTAAYGSAGGQFNELHGLGEEQLTDLVDCTEDADCGSGICKIAPECSGAGPCCAEAFAYQVRSVTAYDNRFYGCGSLINDAARVRLPSKEPGATFHFQTVVLQEDGEDGELLDMHMWSDTSMIVVGSDQSGSQPLIFVSEGDPYSKDNWTRIDLSDNGIDWDGRAFAVSAAGDNVVVVGEKSPSSNGGFIIASSNKGHDWADVTPETGDGKIASLESVRLFENGDIVATGNTTWIYTNQ